MPSVNTQKTTRYSIWENGIMKQERLQTYTLLFLLAKLCNSKNKTGTRRNYRRRTSATTPQNSPENYAEITADICNLCHSSTRTERKNKWHRTPQDNDPAHTHLHRSRLHRFREACSISHME